MSKKKDIHQKRLSIRLDVADYNQFKQQAKKQGLKMSEYQRLLIRHPNQSANASMSIARSNNLIAEKLDEIANGQLAYIGSNLNQIAKKINQGIYANNVLATLKSIKAVVIKAEKKITSLKLNQDEKL